MPLPHTPFRPIPEVEFLGRTPLSVEEAVAALEASCSVGLKGGSTAANVPGSSLVAFRQIPDVVRSLKMDWLPLAADARPSCFFEVHGRMEAHLHPCFMGERLVEGMRGSVGQLLLQYNADLKCMPLGFKRLYPAGTHAAIVAESPYVHFLIEFHAIGFAPSIGMRMLGRPAETQTAIGCNVKVLNVFNVFVSKRDLPQDARFEQQEGKWVRGPEKRPLVNPANPSWVEVKDHLNLKGILDLEAGSVAQPAMKKRKSKHSEGIDAEAAGAGRKEEGLKKRRKEKHQ